MKASMTQEESGMLTNVAPSPSGPVLPSTPSTLRYNSSTIQIFSYMCVLVPVPYRK
jgi:hypothetical protein